MILVQTGQTSTVKGERAKIERSQANKGEKHAVAAEEKEHCLPVSGQRGCESRDRNHPGVLDGGTSVLSFGHS